MKRGWYAGLSLALLFGCNESALKSTGSDAGTPGGFSAEQAARVVAKVGDRTITLGEFAKTLERMDQFDRLRYQSKPRRRELLQEMIDVQLLADEARRRGLDKDPEAQDAIRGILRDAMLAKAREGLPAPADLPEAEVRAYYDSHADKFSEPERRRVAAIVLPDKASAEKVLKEAVKAKTPAEWGELFFKHSITAPPKRGPVTPVELAGDLGIVGPMDDPRGANDRIPDPVRALAFTLKAAGDVADTIATAQGKYYVVRVNGITAAHKRGLAEADRAIRVLLIQEKVADREKALEQELRKQFPVEIDEKALAGVKVPDTASSAPTPASPAPDATTKPDAGR